MTVALCILCFLQQLLCKRCAALQCAALHCRIEALKMLHNLHAAATWCAINVSIWYSPKGVQSYLAVLLCCAVQSFTQVHHTAASAQILEPDHYGTTTSGLHLTGSL